jgi:hypothetical protein
VGSRCLICIKSSTVVCETLKNISKPHCSTHAYPQPDIWFHLMSSLLMSLCFPAAPAPVLQRSLGEIEMEPLCGPSRGELITDQCAELFRWVLLSCQSTGHWASQIQWHLWRLGYGVRSHKAHNEMPSSESSESSASSDSSSSGRSGGTAASASSAPHQP